MDNVLTMLLAGGRGSRLGPLTRERAKPAVPFGGMYRIVDFALSNCLNNRQLNILVLTQHKSRMDAHTCVGTVRGYSKAGGGGPPRRRV
jgi:glucose-1-phosphate adenylyltransferase